MFTFVFPALPDISHQPFHVGSESFLSVFPAPHASGGKPSSDLPVERKIKRGISKSWGHILWAMEGEKQVSQYY